MMLSVAGLGMQMAAMEKQAEGAAISASASAQSYMYQSMIAKNNAAIASRNEYFESAAGSADEVTTDLKGRAEAGAVATTAASHGIDPNSFSMIDAADSAAQLQHLSATQQRAQTLRNIWGFKTQAESQVAQADMYNRAAGYAIKAGKVGVEASQASMGATLLTGVAGIVNQMPGGGNMFGTGGSTGGTTGSTVPYVAPSGGGDTTGGAGTYVDYNPGKSDYSTVGGIP
jgi:hypothetical protein